MCQECFVSRTNLQRCITIISRKYTQRWCFIITDQQQTSGNPPSARCSTWSAGSRSSGVYCWQCRINRVKMHTLPWQLGRNACNVVPTRPTYMRFRHTRSDVYIINPLTNRTYFVQQWGIMITWSWIWDIPGSALSLSPFRLIVFVYIPGDMGILKVPRS